jgi:valine--pyruvate aminotransferase
MDDLGEALAAGERMSMLGGGNPARIPEVEAVFTERMREMLSESGEFQQLIGNYDMPQGNRELIAALVGLFRERYGWDLGCQNIALTNGSQPSFFWLFNLLAGEQETGPAKKILLPLTPEYIGYTDLGLVRDFFLSNRPEIELLGDDLFKYHIDFDALEVTKEVAAICVSRPTNPTSNVLTEGELERLNALALENDVPLIIDNAYGTPFPNIIFADVEPIWNENIILTMSLSKLGLPGARTGIVVAREEIVSAIAGFNAIISLAPGSLGAYLARDLVASGEIIDMSRKFIRPFYERKSAQALEWIRESMSGLHYRVHKPEGTFFFWMWLEGMHLTSHELYERLKNRGVLVVPGHYFFAGHDRDWRHKQECIRVNYSQDEETVRKGIEIIAEEVRKAF